MAEPPLTSKSRESGKSHSTSQFTPCDRDNISQGANCSSTQDSRDLNARPPTQTIKKNDFVELDFTAKIVDTDEVFDTTLKKDAEEANLEIKNPEERFKPHILSVGNSMVIKGLDKSLEGKEIGKQYTEQFPADQAFGKRNPQLVKMIPLRALNEQNIQPQRGMQLALDGQVVRIVSVSGGRVLADFNNPLSGRTVEYKFKINKKIADQDEKINSLQDFLFRQKFEFTLNKEKKSVTFKLKKEEEPFKQFIELMSKPFKEILKLDVKAEIIEKKVEKPSEKDKPKEENKSTPSQSQ